MDAYIAIGSNLNDRESYLSFAVGSLEPVAYSNVYETEPVGGPPGQDPFLNMVVKLETRLGPFALLQRCNELEAEAGRVRTTQNAARELDLDIIFYGDTTISSDDLTVPHPRFAARAFVLAPLEEIAPHLCPPNWRQSVTVSGIRNIGPLWSA